jgi:sugar lactone lactonase YvrE
MAVALTALAFAGSASAAISYQTQWGSEGNGDGQFSYPSGIATDTSGNVYVADRGNFRIQKFDSSGSFINQWGSYGDGDGQFSLPRDVAIDPAGNVYVADTQNDRIQKFDSSGTFNAKWGSEGNGDGQFSYPSGIATDTSGNVYVADTENHRIQKFDSSGTFIAKWGSEGTGDGQFREPIGIATDSTGNVFVADNRLIQKFDSSGTFLTGWRQDFFRPGGIAADSSGYVFVVSLDSHSILKLFDSGQQHTLTVNKGGTGVGTVTSTPSGIDCGSNCSEVYSDGTSVTLTPTSSPGSYFAGWSGAGCSGFGVCHVTLTSDQTATANFLVSAPPPPPPPWTAPDTVLFTGPIGENIIGPNGWSGFQHFSISDATFTFAGSPAIDTAKIQCRIATEPLSPSSPVPFVDCTSPKTFTDLSDGQYSVEFRAEDAAGRKDNTPASYGFTVDTVAPVVEITSGPSGVSNSATPAAAFRANEMQVRFECRLNGSDFTLCSSPVSATVTPGLSTTLTPGVNTFEVRGKDLAGNVSQSTTLTWTFDPASPTSATSGTVPAGGVVATDPANSGPTLEQPATAAVTLPNGGTVEIVQGPSGGQAPTGFSVVGQQFSITAPDATVSDPLVLSFRLDSSALPAGVDIGSLTLLRDGVAAADCSGPEGTAVPDPCVSSREQLPDGDVVLTILSSRASDWIVAYKVADETDPDEPVLDEPVVENAKISKVSVIGQAKARKGKTTTYKVAITNSGNAEATGVRLKVSGKGVKAKNSVGKIAPGKSKTVKIKLNFKKPGRAKVSFKVTSENAGGKTVRKKIKVSK